MAASSSKAIPTFIPRKLKPCSADLHLITTPLGNVIVIEELFIAFGDKPKFSRHDCLSGVQISAWIIAIVGAT